MILPVIATFEEKATGRRITGQISPTTLSDIESQQRWEFADSALDRKWNWWRIWLACQADLKNF
ncbi:MAG TPA: hypothetical protein VFR76_07260 [Verrucomicrobiae bacterium]|nr:hypothetical protein [Verrucomicrobiae bacterium]